MESDKKKKKQQNEIITHSRQNIKGYHTGSIEQIYLTKQDIRKREDLKKWKPAWHGGR